MRVGVLLGGASREREVSYAGGRTVYDLLDRRRFEPVPLFVDAYHRLVRLKPAALYYGMITDFFPPPEAVPAGISFPIYAEALWHPENAAYLRALSSLGPILTLESLREAVDVVFPVLHGLGGEDGSLQGLLEQLGLPYVGSGIGASAWGMDKAQQRRWLEAHGFAVPRYVTVPRRRLWEARQETCEYILDTVGLPCVVKHPLQGSTIGVVACFHRDELEKALWQAAFTWPVTILRQTPLSALLDLETGLGLPFLYRDGQGIPREVVSSWTEFQAFLGRLPKQGWVEAWDAPEVILVEAFIAGEEFSVIVLEGPDGQLVALPPTHIRKAGKVYDYRAKYLAGISSKQTPSSELPNSEISQLAQTLAEKAGVRVYARLDGIWSTSGELYFNDPNTTSGMLPASLLFHQAAEVGFTPTSFLSYLIDRSLDQTRTGPLPRFVRRWQLQRRPGLSSGLPSAQRIAVIFGGASTERHISVESGRNVVQKLSSRYSVLPLFLRVRGDSLELWELPPRLLFKDNADDIAASLDKAEIPAVTAQARTKLEAIDERYERVLAYGARLIPWEALPALVDFVFLALHGRPGEDGTVQRLLEHLRLPYNGSPPDTCELLMDKYRTNAYLLEKGFRTAPHALVSRESWEADPDAVLAQIQAAVGPGPWIGKPVDEGCSSGVRLLRDRAELQIYLSTLLRSEEQVPAEAASRLQIAPDEPFPPKEQALIEAYLPALSDGCWVEVTVGVISHTAPDGGVRYEAFWPSETVKSEAVLRLEEKFLAGAGQNVTPARLFPSDPARNQALLAAVQAQVVAIAQAVGIHGYARLDGFVEIVEDTARFWLLEVNTLPGLTPATVFFHQVALAGYTPLAILEHILSEGQKRRYGARL